MPPSVSHFTLSPSIDLINAPSVSHFTLSPSIDHINAPLSGSLHSLSLLTTISRSHFGKFSLCGKYYIHVNKHNYDAKVNKEEALYIYIYLYIYIDIYRYI